MGGSSQNRQLLRQRPQRQQPMQLQQLQTGQEGHNQALVRTDNGFNSQYISLPSSDSLWQSNPLSRDQSHPQSAPSLIRSQSNAAPWDFSHGFPMQITWPSTPDDFVVPSQSEDGFGAEMDFTNVEPIPIPTTENPYQPHSVDSAQSNPYVPSLLDYNRFHMDQMPYSEQQKMTPSSSNQGSTAGIAGTPLPVSPAAADLSPAPSEVDTKRKKPEKGKRKETAVSARQRQQREHNNSLVSPWPANGPPNARGAAARHGLKARSGGRGLGSHLTPDQAAGANEMRSVGACWLCVFQRDKCTPGDPCQRCLKRATRSNPGADVVLECVRTKLPDMIEYFLPEEMVSIFKPEAMKAFAEQHLGGWAFNPIPIMLTPGKGLPPLQCELYEFSPKDVTLTHNFQYVVDPTSGKTARKIKWSPPLAMKEVNEKHVQTYEKYVDEIAGRYLREFTRICFLERNSFQTRLLELICDVQLSDKKEKELLNNVLRLLVVTYVMGHSLTIVENSKEQSLSQMKSFWRNREYALGDRYCASRMASRQLKYLFYRLHEGYLVKVLSQLQQILKQSGGSSKWTASFCAILGLAMAHEDTQQTIQLLMDAKVQSEEVTEWDAQKTANKTCERIDDRFSFITKLFSAKYKSVVSPLNETGESRKAGLLRNEGEVAFVNDVKSLVSEKWPYLTQLLMSQQTVTYESSVSYTSRLVARFLVPLCTPKP
ncbi:hypothetical protein BDY21DRAFT_97217 [Lineolata rhizophorae]|uniref:Uncharacterized protein n=1 Tax=Lineolata rhizophorae TaxID=578093 RepID=A0A6A6NTV4_9PEZI|nr:hypothetical protein BDY21DRAFT_97217 [Lineolata rhizophorae]